MRVLDWWTEDNEQNFYDNIFIRLLQRKYEVVYSDTPDFVLCGPFGYKHLEYRGVRIFCTGENVRPDFNLVDYAISFDYAVFGDRHLRTPLMFLCDDYVEDMQKVLNSRAHLIKSKIKFCSFIASNNYMTEMRDSFFEALCTYKKVDSGGKWKNNIGVYVDDKIEWLKSYKFNICFENDSSPGYLTEKLFDAFMGGCVPIYWGDTSLRCKVDNECGNLIETQEIGYHLNLEQTKKEVDFVYNGGGYGMFDTRIPNIPAYLFDYKINPKAFINAHDFPTFKELIDEIKRIDNDEQAFKDMLNEPVFLNNFNPKEFYSQKTFHFLDYIVSQGPVCAKRIGRGSRLQRKENIMRMFPYDTDSVLIPNFMSYCVKHKKIIDRVRRVCGFPRDIMRTIRGK
ncbi:glycosyltransferase family 10 domain-containing protein [Helicobacter trogontum]|nr:glycosyltransferase family 10 [Helicobacter trogontum]